MEPRPLGQLLPAAAQNLAPARHASKPSETTEDEQTFAVARRAPTLAELGEEGLKQVLTRLYSLTGLRAHHLPVGGDKVLLHRQILKHYGQHTQQEVVLAFEMALTGRFDLEPKEVQVYDQFTFAYFARIMTAYRSWAIAVARQAETKEPPPEPRKPTPLELKLLDLDYACARAWMHQHALKPPLSNVKR